MNQVAYILGRNLRIVGTYLDRLGAIMVENPALANTSERENSLLGEKKKQNLSLILVESPPQKKRIQSIFPLELLI